LRLGWGWLELYIDLPNVEVSRVYEYGWVGESSGGACVCHRRDLDSCAGMDIDITVVAIRCWHKWRAMAERGHSLVPIWSYGGNKAWLRQSLCECAVEGEGGYTMVVRNRHSLKTSVGGVVIAALMHLKELSDYDYAP
jgi:hypothetical protein